MAILVQRSETTAALRRMYFHCVDAADGISAELGEAAGQPQISINGGAWGNSTNTLVAIGNGRYYLEPTALELGTLGTIEGRYKSANTAESVGTTLQVVPYDPYLATQPVNMTQIGGNSVAGNAATLTLKQLDIQNNAGDAMVCTSTNAGSHGINATGNTGGNGINATGGALGDGIQGNGGTDGNGIHAYGGATTGSGFVAAAQTEGHGIYCEAVGTNEHGIYALGGATTGDGIKAEAKTEGDGIYALAKGTAEHGIYARGGDTSGDGIKAEAVTSGHGLYALAKNAGHGIFAYGGDVTGEGIKAEAQTEGDGIYALGKGTGEHGILAVGGDTTGDGINAIAATSGNGITATGATNGNGMSLEGVGTGEGFKSIGAAIGKGGVINVAVDTTVAAVTTPDTVFTLTAGSAANDAYNNMVCAIYDVSGSLVECRRITDYVGIGKTVTVDADFSFTIQAGVDIVRIFQSAYAPTVAAGGGATAAQVWDYDVSGVTTQDYAGTYQKITGGRP